MATLIQHFLSTYSALFKISLLLQSPAICPRSLFVLTLISIQSILLPIFLALFLLDEVNIWHFTALRFEEVFVTCLFIYLFLQLSPFKSRFVQCTISYIGTSLFFYCLCFLISVFSVYIKASIIPFFWLVLWMFGFKAHILKATLQLSLTGALMCVFLIEFFLRSSYYDPLLLIYHSFFIL